MTVNNIRNQILGDKTGVLRAATKSSEMQKTNGFDGDMLAKKARMNAQAQPNREEHVNAEEKRARHAPLDSYINTLAASAALHETDRISAQAVTECAPRHISYQQSDYVKICVKEGATYKAQMMKGENKVYVEQKNEDGTVKGFEIDPALLDKDTASMLEQAALYTWEQVNEEQKTDEGTLREALDEYYAYATDQIKNGPPKIQTGGAEFSVKEWEKLIEKVDKNLDAVKEEQEKRKEDAVDDERVQKLLEDHEKTKEQEEKVLGIGFINSADGKTAYGMVAQYATNSTDENPIIRVSVQSSSDGSMETYEIEVNKINAQNATELEMFALCNYLDDIGAGSKSTFGTWQTLKVFDRNACENNETTCTETVDTYRGVRKNWLWMCGKMTREYENANVMEQVMDGKKLTEILAQFTSGSYQP